MSHSNNLNISNLRHHVDRLQQMLNDWEELNEVITSSTEDVSNADNDSLLNDHQILEAMQGACDEFSRDLRTVKINMLPSNEYNIEMSNGDQLSCAICINDFLSKEIIRTLPCNHRFHVECIDKWLQSNSTCPMCRARVIHE
uniref:RING-type domain-containing protein n=1 Tax=Glossina brevipalpis TaxID=37001 RepID=A0A1A9VZT5_9MUSC